MKKIDLSKHELVPKHEIVSEKEKEKIIKHYGPLKLFPRISVNDPQVKLLGAKIGDLIRIKRKSPVAGEYKYYRVVVKR